jgi:hypothetical protein
MKLGITTRQEGENVLLIVDGKLISVMPWNAAQKVSMAILSQAKKAEEIAKAESIIHDNAILHRAGSPIGLSTHPKILEETKKEAVHNKELRRYMPNIKTKEFVFPPSIRNVS